jgi:hypothetical protein
MKRNRRCNYRANSLVPFIKVFSGAGAGYNSSNISQVVKNFKMKMELLNFSDKRLRDRATSEEAKPAELAFYHDEGGFVKVTKADFF